MSESLDLRNTFYLSDNQYNLLKMSSNISRDIRLNDQELFSELESAPGVIIYQVSNIHLILGAGAIGEGVVFDNVDKQIKFLNIHRIASGLGIGFQNLYVVVKINDKNKLQDIVKNNNVRFDARFMFMFGVWGKQFSIMPGLNIVYMKNDGFDLGWQWGPAFYSSQRL